MLHIIFRLAHFIMLFFCCGLSQGEVLNAPDFAALADTIETKYEASVQNEHEIREAQKERLLAYLNNSERYYIDQNIHRKMEWEHRIKAFQWQFWSSIVVFIMVILLIITGLYFSYLQFRASEFGTNEGTNHTTHISFSRDGIAISSPVIGLLVLFISLGFFYLYLKEVYPLHVIQGDNKIPQQVIDKQEVEE